jgi:hypothetical protein
MTGEMVAMVIPVTFFLVIGWSIRTIVTNRRLRDLHRAQIEMQQKLLDRFGTAPEMRDFLESEGGKRFIETTVREKANPYVRILSSVQTGIITVMVGAAFMASRNLLPDDGIEGFTFLGLMALLVGAGFLVSAGSVYLLSRSWGLLPAAGSRELGEV